MIPLVDMHCHLLAGLDDGPRTPADALEMCRIAYDDGIRLSSALAHTCERWSAVTPQMIRAHAQQLAGALRQANIPLLVFPSAEVMVHADIESAWQRGELLSVADRGKYLLVELPHGLFIDLRAVIEGLGRQGVRVILAHPERHPELLHDAGTIEQLIELGCLIQVSAHSVTDPPSSKDARTLRDWFRRGVVHLLGSDGHSPRRRRPKMARAYREIARWAGASAADRICSTNPTAVVHGLPMRVPAPERRRKSWFPRLW